MHTSTFDSFKTREVKAHGHFLHDHWYIKLYSIAKGDGVNFSEYLEGAKRELSQWLKNAEHPSLHTYKVATLILHKGKEGCFAIVSWWVDQNMLQIFVYLAADENPGEYILYSKDGIVTCVWEMAVLWHERNAWVKHILQQAEAPDFTAYINDQMSGKV